MIAITCEKQKKNFKILKYILFQKYTKKKFSLFEKKFLIYIGFLK